MNPLLVLALLEAASVGGNVASQRQQDKARAGVMKQERERRERISKESAAKAQSTTDLLVGAASKEKSKAAELAAEYQGAQTQMGAPAATPTQGIMAPHTGRVVQQIEDERGRGRAFTDQQAQSRAKLNAFGDVFGNAGIAVGRNAQDIDQGGASLRNWAQFVMPAQMARANQAGRGWGTFADIAQLAASLYAPTALKAPPSITPGGTMVDAPVAQGIAPGEFSIDPWNSPQWGKYFGGARGKLPVGFGVNA